VIWLTLTVFGLLLLLAGLARSMARDPPERLTGVYGGGAILPHRALPWVTVGARDARRLRAGDRVEFQISPRTGQARAVRVYRKMM
jgi:hypothetical protein